MPNSCLSTLQKERPRQIRMHTICAKSSAFSGVATGSPVALLRGVDLANSETVDVSTELHTINLQSDESLQHQIYDQSDVDITSNISDSKINFESQESFHTTENIQHVDPSLIDLSVSEDSKHSPQHSNHIHERIDSRAMSFYRSVTDIPEPISLPGFSSDENFEDFHSTPPNFERGKRRRGRKRGYRGRGNRYEPYGDSRSRSDWQNSQHRDHN